MMKLTRSFVVCGVSAAAALGAIAPYSSPTEAHAARRCTMSDEPAQVLVAVERDTLMPLVETRKRFNSASGVAPGPGDSLLAMPGTLMASARVRVLGSDSVTRQALASAGIAGAEPVAFIQAQPYRADCRTLRWTDAAPWTVAGDTGYARATLAPREAWIGGTPVFTISPAWRFPYPRQTGELPYHLYDRIGPQAKLRPGIGPATLSSARGYFSFVTTVQPTDSLAKLRAWIDANLIDARREPILSRIRTAILGPDFRVAREMVSRVRGSYRVEMTAGEQTVTWQFRTVDKPSQTARDWEDARMLDDLLASPYSSGYVLVAYPPGEDGALPDAAPRPALGTFTRKMAWLRVRDRITAPNGRSDSVLFGELEFTRATVPAAAWRALDPYVNPVDSMTKAARARLGGTWTDADDQAVLPVTVRVSPTGVVLADTTLVSGSARLRVKLERMDTVAVRRPF